MIKSFKHKGLQKFYETGNTSGIQQTALDTAIVLNDIDLPGFRFHPLKGKMQGFWAIDVSKNWRITFKFIDGDVYIINYEDHHK